MILYLISAIVPTKEEGLGVIEGARSGAIPLGIMLGLYQDRIWVGLMGTLGPFGRRSVDFGPGGPLAEIAEVVFDGDVGEETLWRVIVLDVSALVRRFGFPRGYLFWVVSYFAFGHRISEGVYVAEARDYRDPSG